MLEKVLRGEERATSLQGNDDADTSQALRVGLLLLTGCAWTVLCVFAAIFLYPVVN